MKRKCQECGAEIEGRNVKTCKGRCTLNRRNKWNIAYRRQCLKARGLKPRRYPSGSSREIAQKIVTLLLEDKNALQKWIELFKFNPLYVPKKTIEEWPCRTV